MSTALLLAVALLLVWPAEAGKVKKAIEALPEPWRVWLEEEVYPLITDEQRDAFLALESEAQRQEFAERLWNLWGHQTGIGAPFRKVYEDRLRDCRLEFNSTLEDRARALLIHGPPDARQQSRCDEVFNELEFWIWSYLPGIGEDVVVLFYRPGGVGPMKLWNPFWGRQVLYTFGAWESRLRARSRLDTPELSCFDGDTLLRLLASAEYWLRDSRTMAALSHLPDQERQRGSSSESASARFMEFSALLPANAEPLDFEVHEKPRGLRGGMVRLGFELSLPSEGLGQAEVGDIKIVQLDVVGEISREAEMVDRFRYLFTVPAASDRLGLLFERFLRPGDYELRVKVEDTHSHKAAVTEMNFVAAAPTPEQLAALAGAPAAPTVRGPTVASVNAKVPADAEQPTLLLVGPQGEVVSGLQRFEAVTKPVVARVSFLVDGRQILVKNKPPFDVDLDLGALPRLTTVTAVAYDASGLELDRRQLNVNIGRERFFVRLQPVTDADREQDQVRVTAECNIPSDVKLERFELYWNDLLLTTLFQEPLDAWVPLGARGEFGYLHAVATLSDGSVAEDVQLVNAPEFGSVVEVTAVELPVTVLDRDGQPVEDLKPEEFTVLEDGVPQSITQVSLHRDLPVRLGIVVDTSGSMEQTLPDVQRVVMGFLNNFLRPRDRAYIETFSDQPEVLAGLTADTQTLQNALLATFADRATAFYDAVITGLFQFAGMRGRRTMVVLTDGEDNASKHTFDEALHYAQRAGVTIYTIGIDLPLTKVQIRFQLKRLAESTGGRAFFLNRDALLEGVYDTIDRELRTQYLVAYTSTSEKPVDELREIKVEVARKGLKVRTMSGFYPRKL